MGHSRGSCDHAGPRPRPAPVSGRLGISPLKDPCRVRDGARSSCFLRSVFGFPSEEQQGPCRRVPVSDRVSLCEEVALGGVGPGACGVWRVATGRFRVHLRSAGESGGRQAGGARLQPKTHQAAEFFRGGGWPFLFSPSVDWTRRSRPGSPAGAGPSAGGCAGSRRDAPESRGPGSQRAGALPVCA